MSEKYNSNSKSTRRHKDDKSSRRKNSDQALKKYEIEAKTPPLPKNSIEELMRQRESLRKELEQLNVKKSVEKKTSKEEKNSRDSRKRKHDDDCKTSISRKNDLVDSKRSLKKTRKQSPEYNTDKYFDSEDEESIIEQRRKQRRQLLEKLNVTNTSTNIENNKPEDQPSEKKTMKGTASPIKKSKKDSKDSSAKLSDMFSDKDDFVAQNIAGVRDTKDENNSQLTDNWDDAEGYYNIRTGDILKNKYVLKEVLGQGVFANVIHAQDKTKKDASVAIKIVRNNALMYKTSLKEISILKEINEADPDNKYHCVKYICNFMHKGHLCIVLEALHMDLRSILKKYGKNHGIHMKALMSYSRQLLVALRLLKKIGIMHADIKPDNILVNEKKNVLKLCDFGSAAKFDENEPTPYLVSRFYRAPEIILGAPYNHGIDIWSTACTVFEMATGKILFTGNSNNRMLKCFMDVKGKIPVKLIKRGKFKDQHFNYNNNFLLHKKDEFTGRDKVIEVFNHNPSKDLHKELLKSCKNLTPGEDKKLGQLKDLLDKMLMLDPNQRLTVTDCLKHPFIQEELEK